MEQQLLCPNCRAENMPGALTCYKCNSKMPGAPNWVGPTSFRVYDPSNDRGIAYLFAIIGGLGTLFCLFLSWLSVPKAAEDALNRGTSAFDILFGSTGSKSAIGGGGVGENSVGADVRLVIALIALAALVAITVSILKPYFLILLLTGLLIIVGAIYFFVQLALRNNAQFNTPDLVGLLGWGFWGTIVSGALIVGASLRYRPQQMMQTRTQ